MWRCSFSAGAGEDVDSFVKPAHACLGSCVMDQSVASTVLTSEYVNIKYLSLRNHRSSPPFTFGCDFTFFMTSWWTQPYVTRHISGSSSHLLSTRLPGLVGAFHCPHNWIDVLWSIYLTRPCQLSELDILRRHRLRYTSTHLPAETWAFLDDVQCLGTQTGHEGDIVRRFTKNCLCSSAWRPFLCEQNKLNSQIQWGFPVILLDFHILNMLEHLLLLLVVPSLTIRSVTECDREPLRPRYSHVTKRDESPVYLTSYGVQWGISLSTSYLSSIFTYQNRLGIGLNYWENSN